MAEIVRMPKLSDTMTEGVVAEWHKKVGDPVESGEVLAEIETDKATMEFESFQDGVLLHIGVDKGATAAVDSILAILGEAGEDVSSLLTAEAEAPVEAAAPTPTPAPAPAGSSGSCTSGSSASSGSGGCSRSCSGCAASFFQWKGQGFAACRPFGCRTQH
jgi:pyruvate dehydrogenase E2 component (dihydrolipoamide acetyltransferase)